jgi:hypothetical protein
MAGDRLADVGDNPRLVGVAAKETVRLMSEIDKAIPKWPAE